MGVIDRATVTGFQAIKKAEVEFPAREGGGSITTIVGASSTGKSAFLRALNVWANNTASVPVRAGETSTVIDVLLSDGTTVTAERGKSLSTFTVDEQKYTKAGTTVPDPVSDVTRLRKNSPDVHFSFQFDKPYLLSESGSTIATVLGKLTNANVLRDATREGARRSLRLKQEASLLREGARLTEEQIDTFSDIPQEQKRLQEATEAAEKARELSTAADVLTYACATYNSAAVKLAAAQSDVVNVPNAYTELSRATDLIEEAATLDSWVLALVTNARVVQSAKQQQAHANTQERAAANAYTEALQHAGTCPTCALPVPR